MSSGTPEIKLPPCGRCKHWQPSVENLRKCLAFPAGIPDSIWLYFRKHIKPVAGDNGIRFEPMDEKVRHE